jgi:hypothetical protein
VYLLVEHQSSTDPLMAFRMLRNVTRIWDQHLRGHPNARQLPAVIPLVVHHDRSRWTSPAQLLDLIDLGPADKQAMRAYPAPLRVPPRRPRRRRGPAATRPEADPVGADHLAAAQDRPGQPPGPAELRPWTSQLRAVLDQPGGGEAFIALLTYIELVSEAPASELRDLAASLGPDAEKAYMTTAEMLRAEGEAHGRAEALVQVLTVKFGPLPDSVPQTVHAAPADQIQAWTARAVTAETLDQVFS